MQSSTNERLDGGVVEVLEGFRKCPSLTDVTLEWRVETVSVLQEGLLYNEKIYKKLDCVLLIFSQPRFVCTIIRPLPTNGSSLWFGELRKHLPALSQRGVVTLQSQCRLDHGKVCHGLPPRIQLTTYQAIIRAEHDDSVRALAVSPDSKWVASGSKDSTIILWNADNGTIVQQWVAHGYRQIVALAFSPDSRYVVSGGWEDNNAAIWDISREPRKVAILEEDAPRVPDTLQTRPILHPTGISACAWSPDGRTIATGDSEGTVRLWDARTFRQRAFHKLSGVVTDPLAFSPDGYRLLCITFERQCSILDVALGAPHKSLNPYGYVYLPTDDPLGPPSIQPFSVWSAAFDPTGTRLAFTSGLTHYIIDIETGNALLTLDGSGKMSDISFSPNGETCAWSGLQYMLHLGRVHRNRAIVVERTQRNCKSQVLSLREVHRVHRVGSHSSAMEDQRWVMYHCSLRP